MAALQQKHEGGGTKIQEQDHSVYTLFPTGGVGQEPGSGELDISQYVERKNDADCGALS